MEQTLLMPDTRTKPRKVYCEYYGMKTGTLLAVMVCHLRSCHRIKIGTDYWVKTNNRGIIVKPAWEKIIREHLTIYIDDEHFQVQVKAKPGRNQKVYEYTGGMDA
jgi:hypothetical protein